MHALAIIVALAVPGELVLGADVGWPKLASEEFRLAGGLALGWQTDRWSIVASGDAAFYDLGGGDDPVVQQTLSLRGALDGSYLTGDLKSLARFEVIASVGGALYDAETLGAADMPLDEQTSVLGRAGVLVGVRLRPIDRIRIHVRAGGGVQYEFFDYLRVGVGTAELSDNEELTFRLQARLLVRASIWPQYLSVRFVSEFDRFALTRDTSSIAVGPGSQPGLQFDLTRARSTQVEVRSKLFVTLDVLSFADLFPAVFVGIDVIDSRGGGSDATVVLPIFGVGLFGELDT